MKRETVLYEKQRACAYVYSKVNFQGIPEAMLQTYLHRLSILKEKNMSDEGKSTGLSH